MSLRGRDVEQSPSTIDGYLRVYPDVDELDGPYDENWPLTLKMAWLSRAALTNVTGGRGTSPVPTPQPGAPDPSSSEGRPAAGCHSDASDLVDVTDRIA